MPWERKEREAAERCSTGRRCLEDADKETHPKTGNPQRDGSTKREHYPPQLLSHPLSTTP